MLRNYKLAITVDKKSIEMQDQIDTNFREGEATQMATLFYRMMLAMGYSPALASEAIGKVAIAHGFSTERPEPGLFDLEEGTKP